MPCHKPQFIHGRQCAHYGCRFTFTLPDLSREKVVAGGGPCVSQDIDSEHPLHKASLCHPQPAIHHCLRQRGSILQVNSRSLLQSVRSNISLPPHSIHQPLGKLGAFKQHVKAGQHVLGSSPSQENCQGQGKAFP